MSGGSRPRALVARATVASAVAALLLAGCSSAQLAPAAYRASPEASGVATAQCRAEHPPRVLFLALEAYPYWVEGLRYFVSDWGERQGCFSGRVVTPKELGAVREGRYDVLVIDMSYGQIVTAPVAAAVEAAADRGKPIALFAQPGLVGDHSPYPAAVAKLRPVFAGLRFTRPRSTNALNNCNAVKLSGALSRPFDLEGQILFYESPFHGVFTATLAPPARPLATTLRCSKGSPVIVRRGDHVVAGFNLAYEVTRADNHRSVTTTKRVLVDVVYLLSRTSR